MAVMAPVSELSLAALARFTAGLPLPEIAPPAGERSGVPSLAALPLTPADAAPKSQSSVPDIVVFSSAPMRVLSDVAAAGLRQLTALLPVLEQAVQAESVTPLGFLAKAVATAARQIGDGHPALLAEGPDRVAAALRGEVAPRSSTPATALTDTKELLRTLARELGAETEPTQDGRPNETLRTIARQIGAVDQMSEPRSMAEPGDGPIQRWLGEAKHILRSTGDTLDRAEQQVRPLLADEPRHTDGLLAGQAAAGSPAAAWVLTEILAAQANVAMAYAAVGQARSAVRLGHRPVPHALSLDHLAGATTLFGMALIISTLWLVGGIWSLATGSIALGGAAIWIWRINRASRGLTLDARR